MIHDIGVALQAKLAARGCPFRVVDGPEDNDTTTWGRERIVIERLGADRPAPVRSQRPNPQHRTVRIVGAKITIYAQSTKRGSKRFEHEWRADEAVDFVLVALDDIAGDPSPIYNVWKWDGGEYVVPADLDESRRWGGAVYELRVTFDRAVFVRQVWTGGPAQIAPEATVGGVNGVGVENIVEASITGSGNYEQVIP